MKARAGIFRTSLSLFAGRITSQPASSMENELKIWCERIHLGNSYNFLQSSLFGIKRPVDFLSRSDEELERVCEKLFLSNEERNNFLMEIEKMRVRFSLRSVLLFTVTNFKSFPEIHPPSNSLASVDTLPLSSEDIAMVRKVIDFASDFLPV